MTRQRKQIERHSPDISDTAPTKKTTRPKGTKPSGSRASRGRNQCQETLTQIDFVRISHYVDDEDSAEDGDEEFALRNSRKRKRKSSPIPNKRQQTLTQIDWTPRLILSDGEEDLELSQDNAAISMSSDSDSNQQHYFREDEVRESMLEGPSHNAPTTRADFDEQDAAEEKRTPEGSRGESERRGPINPTTPKTIRVQEVPSSQTPSSIPLSTQSNSRSTTRLVRSPTRSPLKEVSSNRGSARIPLSPENLPEKHLSTAASTDKFSTASNSLCRIPRSPAHATSDSDINRLEEVEDDEEIASSDQLLEAKVTKFDQVFAEKKSQGLSRVRTDSEEISSQLNREWLHFTQQQYPSQQRLQNGTQTYLGSQMVADGDDTRNDHPSSLELRPSQVSTVDLTQASSSHSRRVASLPPLELSAPRPPTSGESPPDVPSSPNILRSRLTQQGTVTLSQLLPESLMNFSLPPPPDSPQSSEACG